MLFGMNNDEIMFLIAISVTFVCGLIVGGIISIIFNLKEIKSLNEEVDKFRDLYFNEIDKWRRKYDEDDYEAY